MFFKKVFSSETLVTNFTDEIPFFWKYREEGREDCNSPVVNCIGAVSLTPLCIECIRSKANDQFERTDKIGEGR